MTFLLSVYDAQVNNLLTGDTDIFSQLARWRQTISAVERYSTDKPDAYTEDVSGDGGRYYAMSSLTYWSEGFSRVTQIEYPAATVSSDETPVYLEPEDWQDDYWAEISSTHTRHIYLPSHAPAATDTMRITYTVPYLWTAGGSESTAITQATHGFALNDYVYLDGSTYYAAGDIRNATHQVTTRTDENTFKVKILSTTTPREDFFAICHLAAGLCCQAVAAKYSKLGDSTISIDATGVERADKFAARAREFIALYEEHLGLGKEQEQYPAGEFVDWDTSPSWPSDRGYVFHGKGTR
jgi:hypothetical protein